MFPMDSKLIAVEKFSCCQDEWPSGNPSDLESRSREPTQPTQRLFIVKGRRIAAGRDENRVIARFVPNCAVSLYGHSVGRDDGSRSRRHLQPGLQLLSYQDV